MSSTRETVGANNLTYSMQVEEASSSVMAASKAYLMFQILFLILQSAQIKLYSAMEQSPF